MGMDIRVQRFEIRQQARQVCESGIGSTRFFRVHANLMV